jgi:hypothetical protein
VSRIVFIVGTGARAMAIPATVPMVAKTVVSGAIAN